MPEKTGQAATRIAPDTIVHGTVETPGNLLVEGRVEGEIRCGGVIDVAPGGTCMADVHARRAEIQGEVLGRTACHEAIAVAAGGRVVGDLRAPDISVDGAARVEGRVDLLPPEPEAPAIRRLPVAADGMVRRPASNAEASASQGPGPDGADPSDFADRSAREAVGDATTDRQDARVIPRPPRPQGRVRLARTPTP